MSPGFLVSALVFVAALVWAAALAANGWVIPRSFFEPLSTATAVVSAGLLAFDKVLWRLPGVKLVIGRPDLRGTWKGVLRSSAKDHSGPTVEHEVFAVISQTYSTLHLRLLTEESASETLAASILKHDDDVFDVAVLYRNTPKLAVRDRSEIHLGGLLLRAGGPEDSRLEGGYWTDRWTRGELSLTRTSRKKVTDFRGAKDLEPE